MADQPLCSIPDCGKPIEARGWCRNHYHRWYAHGDPLAGRTAVGALLAEIDRAINHSTPEACWVWRFSRIGRGYGVVQINKERFLVHRLVCQRQHGDPPTSDHEAAHSCGKGHLGCINPHHIRWATHSENCADRNAHGTENSGSKNGQSKLTESQVRQIKERLRSGCAPMPLANEYNVSRSTITDISRGRYWKSIS